MRELIKLSGLELNDGISFDAEEMTFTPAAKKAQWVSNPDADGDALVDEANYTNAFMEFTLRVAHQDTADEAREVLGELTDALQGCERARVGAALTWTPNDSATTYTGHCLLAEYSAIPIVVKGDDAGWFLNAPLVRVKLTLRPFFETPERTVLASVESGAAPLQESFIKGIKGDVPALARLILKDTATQDRRLAAWGRDVVDSEAPPAALITAASLVTTSFSGEAKTRAGAYSEEKVKRATAVSSPTTMCGTGRIKHVGPFGVYLRVYAASAAARFRISYRNGDGALIPLKWVQAPVIENFAEIYMGEVFLDEVTLGTQTSEIRVEVKSAGAATELDVNYLFLWPTGKGSMKARGLANNTPTKLLAYDEFLQTEGALSGKTLPIGGTWSGAGDADDFTVIAASEDETADPPHYVRRTAVSDANLNTGRYAIAGTTEYTTARVGVNVLASESLGEPTLRMGAFARYGNAENWLMAVVNPGTFQMGFTVLTVLKRVSGTVTVLGELTLPETLYSKQLTVTLGVDADGLWTAWASVPGAALGLPLLSGQDAVFATGGSLAKGKVGMYDAWTEAGENVRQLDSFQVLAADGPGRVCYSGRSIEFNSADVLRQDSTGTYAGQPDLPRGANFFLEPEGDNGTINRIVTRMRRNDVVAEADAAVTDKHKTEVLVIERFLLPR